MRHWRLYILFFIFLIIGAALMGRLFFLQIKNHGFYAAMAQGQRQVYDRLEPKRGEIFMKDKNGTLHPLAQNKEWKTIYASPKDIEDPAAAAKAISEVLDIEESFLLLQLKENSSYEILAKRLEEEVASRVLELGIKGIYESQEIGRLYPQNNLASQVVGFLGFRDDKKIGQYGLEGYYDEQLSGNPGIMIGERDVSGNWISVAKKYLNPPESGSDLILTIDPNIQYQAEKILKEYQKKWDAESGTIIVEDPTTGAIKAMASYPNFDPNYYEKVEDIKVFVNPAVQNLFPEPGSILKPITMAAALDAGKISPQTTYFDTGEIKIGGLTIRNSDGKNYEVQTMNQVLEKSLNTGAVFVARALGIDLFRDYVRDFGFNKKTGIDLEGEAVGSIKNLYSGREINLATASFGQGITMTPIQLMTAFSAIANQGKMMRPYMVEEFRLDNGEVETVSSQVLKEVIRPDAAAKLTAMMVSVVENGYGRKAGVEDYWIAGKTGTAQVPFEDKRGYSDKTVHSFIGFGPAFSPEFLILVKLNDPKGIRFASDSVAPAFQKLAQYILNYYEIPSER